MKVCKNKSIFEKQPIRRQYFLICIDFYTLKWQKRLLNLSHTGILSDVTLKNGPSPVLPSSLSREFIGTLNKIFFSIRARDF